MGDVVARLAAQTHTVYFLDGDGRLIDEPRRVAYGQTAQPPEYAPPQGLAFLGWSRDVTCVKEDVYCVALTKAAENSTPQVQAFAGTPEPLPPAQCHQDEEAPQAYRVYVLDLRGASPAGSLLPLGNWSAGEAISDADLSCLHLRNAGQLNFCLQVSCDTVLVLTDAGVRAFDRGSMCPLELQEQALHTWEAQAA